LLERIYAAIEKGDWFDREQWSEYSYKEMSKDIVAQVIQKEKRNFQRIARSLFFFKKSSYQYRLITPRWDPDEFSTQQEDADNKLRDSIMEYILTTVLESGKGASQKWLRDLYEAREEILQMSTDKEIQCDNSVVRILRFSHSSKLWETDTLMI